MTKEQYQQAIAVPALSEIEYIALELSSVVPSSLSTPSDSRSMSVEFNGADYTACSGLVGFHGAILGRDLDGTLSMEKYVTKAEYEAAVSVHEAGLGIK